MDDLQPVHLQDEDAVLAALHALGGVVVDAEATEFDVFEGLVHGVPLEPGRPALGDLGHLLSDDQVRQIGPVDVLMIPVGGVYTINGSKAKEVMAQLKPRMYVLPMHYGTRTFEDLLPPDEFLEGQSNVQRMLNTNELTIRTDFRPPAPVTVLLGWEKLKK